ncbi:MAG: DNA primase [Beijerinckiaceae bacterium]
MRFSQAFLDEIRARIPVSEVVRKRVQLKRAGREWSGLSPFNAEKTPSFTVNDQKGFYHDFSSGRHGDIFRFLVETEGLSFPEAVERLAAEAGVPMPVESPQERERDRKRAGLQEVLEMTAAFFEEQLQGRAGAKARGYLADRGLGPALQQQFRIGYAPNSREALRTYLAGKGASLETMIEAGLLIHGDDIPVAYDRFRDRVMFPICNASGHVIAFGGRALEKDVPAKYLNSPETGLFHKGHVLYNHHNARKAAHDRARIIAVEGYVDVISMSAAGFPETVAACGTALTPDQMGLLWRMAEEPVLCFDGDRAGRKAAFRAVENALPLIGPGRSLRFAFLPEGQDPDDLARSGGHSAIQAVIDAAKPLVEVLLQREIEAGPVDTPERRAGLDKRINDLLRHIPDETLRRYYREDISSRLAALGHGPAPYAGPGARRHWQPGPAGMRPRPGAPSPGYRNAKVAVSPALTRTAAFAANANALSPREAHILLTLVNHPGLLDRYVEDLMGLDVANRDAETVRQALLDLAGGEFESAADLRAALQSGEAAAGLARLDSFAVVATLWVVQPQAAIEDAEMSLKQALALHRRARALHKEFKSAEFAFGQDATEENFARLREIQAELAVLEGQEAALEGFGIMSGRQSRNL